MLWPDSHTSLSASQAIAQELERSSTEPSQISSKDVFSVQPLVQEGDPTLPRLYTKEPTFSAAAPLRFPPRCTRRCIVKDYDMFKARNARETTEGDTGGAASSGQAVPSSASLATTLDDPDLCMLEEDSDF